MFKMSDVVKAKKDLSDRVLKGYEGTILETFTEPSIAYLVEFVEITNEQYEYLDSIFVLPEDIELVVSYKGTPKAKSKTCLSSTLLTFGIYCFWVWIVIYCFNSFILK